jgi:hypothetical protein
VSYGYVHPLPDGDWTIVGTFHRDEPGTLVASVDESLTVRVQPDRRVIWRVSDVTLASALVETACSTIVLRRSARSVEFSVDGRVAGRWTAPQLARAVRLMTGDERGRRDFAVYALALPDETLARLHRRAGEILRLEPAMLR